MSENDNNQNNGEGKEEENISNLPNEQVLIGTFLKNSRMSGKYSLKNLYQKTKINISLLEDLEENRLERLPHKAYVVGFVRNYAKVLNLDVHYCLELLDQSYQVLGLESAPEQVTIDEALKTKSISNATIWAIVGGCTLLALILFLFPKEKKVAENITPPAPIATNSGMNGNNTENTVLPFSPTATPSVTLTSTPIPTVTATVPPRPTVRPTVKPTAPPTLAPSPTPVSTLIVPPPASTAVSNTNPSNETEGEVVRAELQEEVVLRPMEFPIYQIDETVSKEDLQAFLPEAARRTREANIQSLYLVAEDGDSWITYKKDNEPIKKYVLTKGNSLHLVGERIRLFMGNLNVCRLYLNGRLLKIDAPKGVKSLVFPQEKANEFKRPLFLFKKDGSAITSDEWEAGH